MAFQNELFPSVKLVHGVAKSILDPVAIVSNGNTEYRIKRNRYERYQWLIPSNNITDEDKVTISGFLADKDYALDSFKFQDPDLPRLDNAKLGYDNASDWFFNIPYDENTPGKHRVFHSDNLVVTVDGGPAPFGWSLATNSSGNPVIHITSVFDGSDVRVTGDIYFVVRLDSTIGWSIKAVDGVNEPTIVGYSELKLIEVFE
mgnify:CR=1 FL=1